MWSPGGPAPDFAQRRFHPEGRRLVLRSLLELEAQLVVRSRWVKRKLRRARFVHHVRNQGHNDIDVHCISYADIDALFELELNLVFLDFRSRTPKRPSGLLSI